MAENNGVYKKIDIAWNDLSVTVPSKTEKGVILEILKGVSAYCLAGKVTSIMGPSGAGKTTMVRSKRHHLRTTL
jgi:ABC-type multidrug transport system ATPase subunit